MITVNQGLLGIMEGRNPTQHFLMGLHTLIILSIPMILPANNIQLIYNAILHTKPLLHVRLPTGNLRTSLDNIRRLELTTLILHQDPNTIHLAQSGWRVQVISRQEVPDLLAQELRPLRMNLLVIWDKKLPMLTTQMDLPFQVPFRLTRSPSGLDQTFFVRWSTARSQPPNWSMTASIT
jgi:hypothetical protein